MKKINVVELYVMKRIELLERENGNYKFNQKVIDELKDVLDVIHQSHFKPNRNYEIELVNKEPLIKHING